MKTLSQNNFTLLIKYKQAYIRIALALISAHLTVSYQEPENFFELLALPEYYRALASTFGIALIIVEYVYRINIRLNKAFDWEHFLLKRSILQFVLCFLVPIGGDIFWNACYFYVNNTPFDLAEFQETYLFIIELMLLVLNMYYCMNVPVVNFRIKPHDIIEDNIQDREFTPLAEMCKEEGVLMILLEKGTVIGITESGRCALPSRSLEHTLEQLPGEDWFRIRHSEIIHRDNIIKVIKSRRAYQLTLKIPENEILDVSYRRSTDFKVWWDGPHPIEPKP